MNVVTRPMETEEVCFRNSLMAFRSGCACAHVLLCAPDPGLRQSARHRPAGLRVNSNINDAFYEDYSHTVIHEFPEIRDSW